MAQGVPFPQQNFTLVGNPEERAAGTVYDLHGFKFRDLDNVPNIITRWQFDEAELAEVIATGGCWVRCVGESQPPMCVQSDSPFEEPK